MGSGLLLQAVEEARSSGNAPGEAEALARLSQVAWVRGDAAQQSDLLEQALRILQGSPPSRELSTVLTRVVAMHGLAGRSPEVLAAAERALPVVREFGSETDLAVVLQMRGQAQADTGDVAEGFEDLREGLRIALEFSPANLVVSGHVNLGDMVWFADGPAAGQDLYETGAEIGERRGGSANVDWARMQSMWTRLDLGAWDELLDIGQGVLDRELARGGEMWSRQLSVLAAIYRDDVLVHRGSTDAHYEVEGTLLARGREIGDGQVVVPVFRVAAIGRLDRLDVAGAIELVIEMDAFLRDRPSFRSLLLDWASRVCRVAGDSMLLRSLIDQGIDHLTRDANSMASARAALAEIEGDHALALERYGDAATRWGAFPSVLEHGHALAGAGRCLLALGRTREAADGLRQARDRYSSLGAAPLVVEIDELLSRATAKSS